MSIVSTEKLYEDLVINTLDNGDILIMTAEQYIALGDEGTHAETSYISVEGLTYVPYAEDGELHFKTI